MCDRRVLFCCFLLFWVGFFSWWKVCEAVVILNGDGCINISYVRRLCACGGCCFFYACMLIVVVCVGWFCVYSVVCVLCLLWVVCVGCDVGSVWVCGYYICGWLWCGRVVYDVLGVSQGNTGLSRGVCGALCLGVRCWGFPGEYLSDWWCDGALFLGERSCLW